MGLSVIFGLLLVMPLEPIEAVSPIQSTVILDADGGVLQRDTTDGLMVTLPWSEIPSSAIDATIATEDQRYWWHPGVDPIAIARSIIRWHSAPSGASTIPQQLAKRLYLREPSPAPIRKVREAWIALQLSARYPKRTLLAAYLNTIYYGHGAYGIEAAAQTYFGVSARNLDVAQAALLAGLPQAPTAYDPFAHPDAARERQRYVLDRMAQAGRASRTTIDDAAREELTFRTAQPSSTAPHFDQWVLDTLRAEHPELVARTGLRIETTLSRKVQDDAERAVREHLADLEGRNARDAAVVVLDPHTGAVVAMVGGPDFWRPGSGQVNLALQARQPGSALKPFLYAAALQHGYTAATPILDVPSSFTTQAGLYQPLDNDLSFRGPVSMRVSLASSLNIPAVRTLADIGTPAFVRVARDVNLLSLGENEESAGLGLALGTAEVTLLDLTAAYQVWPNDGRWTRPYAIERVTDARGRVLYRHSPESSRPAVDPASAYIISDILSDPEARETGFGGEVRELETSMYTGVKTGSTSGGRDAWTVGFSASRVVGVWVGNADSSAMIDVASITGAAPIWQAVMESAMRGLTSARPAPPPGVEAHTVCAGTGLIPGASCPYPTSEYFVRGTAPSSVEVSYAPSTRPGILLQDVPVDARGWAAALGIDGPPTSSHAAGVTILNPADGAVLYIARELARQEVLLKVAVPAGAAQVVFRLDGRVVATRDPRDPQVVVPLVPGTHSLEVETVVGGTRAATRSSFQVVAP